MADEGRYLLDNQQPEAGTRFDALATLFDASTFRHFDALGVAAGWRCWEVGAGGPSVPSWLAVRAGAGGYVLMVQRGVDLAYGRLLPRLLRDAGLLDVGAEAFFPMTGAACNLLEQATMAQIRDRLIAADLATEDEIDQHLDNVAAGRLDLATAPMISAWGRKSP